MKGWTLHLGSYAFALSGRQRETDDNTQGAASLCPGLGAGCPFRACFNLRDACAPCYLDFYWGLPPNSQLLTPNS